MESVEKEPEAVEVSHQEGKRQRNRPGAELRDDVGGYLRLLIPGLVTMRQRPNIDFSGK